MKLDIQLFSGGSYEYAFYRLDIYHNAVYDDELDLMIRDLQDVLHDLEWWKSGDSSEEDYRKSLNKFKEKWFR